MNVNNNFNPVPSNTPDNKTVAAQNAASTVAATAASNTEAMQNMTGPAKQEAYTQSNSSNSGMMKNYQYFQQFLELLTQFLAKLMGQQQPQPPAQPPTQPPTQPPSQPPTQAPTNPAPVPSVPKPQDPSIPTPPQNNDVNASAVNTFTQTSRFNTLEAFIGKAGLNGAISELEAKGPITILAPTNEAFSKLPADVAAKLQKPENKDVLKEILLYHVQKGALAFDKKGDAKTVDSLLDNNLDKNKFFGSDKRSTFVNGDNVVQGQKAIITENGSKVIPIDEVLIPPGLDLSKLV